MSVGIDIEEVQRFKSLVRNKRFMDRIYTPQEIAYCQSKKNKLQHFAARFAAKEAVWKCLSDVIRARKFKVAHRDIGIKNDPSGKPRVILPRSMARYQKKVSLSLSHTLSTVVAVALVES